VLDDNTRFFKISNKIAYFLYNELSLKHFQIFNKQQMEKTGFTAEKQLDEFLSKIPEKRNIFDYKKSLYFRQS
jgi:hypothetical protein